MHLLRQIHLKYNDITVSLTLEPEKVCSFFSEEICRKSFSGSVTAEITELDYFFLITFGENVIGFFRVIDLYFNNEIELHGSYGYKEKTYMRGFLMLSKMFVAAILSIFPNRQITTVANKRNQNAMHYVKWVGYVEVSDNEDSSDMADFILDKSLYSNGYEV